jgi:hypothetical protein
MWEAHRLRGLIHDTKVFDDALAIEFEIVRQPATPGS